MTTTDDKITKVVDLSAPVARVWQALTDHEEFGHWFRVRLDQPFKTGGKSTGHMMYPGCEHLPWLAHVEQMDEEKLFSFTWNDFDETSPLPIDEQPQLRVEFDLQATPGGTRLTITESGFSAIASPRRSDVLKGNREGWDIQAENLTRHLTE